AVLHARCLDDWLVDVLVEEPGARDEAGFEQADERRQPRETLWIGVGAPDEREHLELTLQVRAVVGAHVHEGALRERRRSAVRHSRQREAATVVHLPDRTAERPRGEFLERRPLLRERRIDGWPLERVLLRSRRTIQVRLLRLFAEPAAVEVHPREP